MKRLVLAAALAASFPWSAQTGELPLKRVVLSTSGLAQFTHAGEISASTVIELPVRLDQVDDVLKSLTIFDASGTIGTVSLAGKTPLAEIFRDLPFGRDALGSRLALLNSLIGAEVEIEGDVKATGRVLSVEVEHVQLPNNGGQTEKHRLTLLAQKGLIQANLEDLSALRFTDAQTRTQIERALAALFQNQAKDRRTVSIALAGQATREAGFSYVVAAPLWKTSYRLVLPKEGGKARLQGWGIVENLTGSDWKDVELTLVSGRPVAFKQALYSAVYADRPEIPISSSSRVVPRKDEAEENAVSAYSLSSLQMKPAARSFASPPSPAAAAPHALAFDGAAARPAAPGSAVAAAEPEEAATQVMFRFPAKISVASGSTLMVPFVDREVGASRTYLYQPETNSSRPLAAVRLRNEGESALPPGILTAFDTGSDGAANFAGDAQLPLFAKGSTKFITFALDSKTDIRRMDQGVKQVRLGKAVNGELTLTVKSSWTIDYEITPPADEDREIIIDEARQDGWKPVGNVKDVEETSGRIRYSVAAPKGKTIKATMRREHIDHQTVSLTSLGPDRLVATISGLENETPILKETIAKLRGVAADIDKINGHRRALEAERKKITDDQDRIRKNLTSVGQGSDLGRRYLDTLKSQEDRLAAIGGEDKALEQELAARTKTAEEIARSLVL